MLKLVGGLEGLLASTISAFALFWLGLGAGIWLIGYAPVGWPNFHVRTPIPFVHFTLRLPSPPVGDGAAVSASRHDLSVCTASLGRLQSSLTAQNAAVTSTARAAQKATQQASLAVHAAHDANVWRFRLAEQLQNIQVVSVDQLGLCRQADQILIEGAQ